MNKKVKIVIEETGARAADGNQPFILYLEGDKERIGKVPDEELSGAEFWGKYLFEICCQVVKETGALKEVHVIPEKGDAH